MKAIWPNFVARGYGRNNQSIRWVGFVEPQFCRYEIEVSYQIPDSPRVRILSPSLIHLHDNKEGMLPHVYPPADDPTLCLFDPEAAEWDWSMPIAKTILPWALDWLVCYEGWLMTGKWYGGGRHAGDPILSKEIC